jgi:hypothetical protein
MSVKVMAQVWDSDLAPNHRLVLLAYADAAEHDGTKSFPGEERLMKMTGYSTATVRRITAELLELKVLVQVRKGHRGQRAEYRVPPPKASHPDTHSEGESLSSEHGKPITGDTPPVLDPSEEKTLPTVVSSEMVLFDDGGSDVERHRDLYYEAACAALDLPHDNSDSGVLGVIGKKARDGDHQPDEILRRAALHLATFDFPLTPGSLVKRWDQLGSKVTTATRSQRRQFAAELDRMRRRQQIVEGTLL